jgi:hypothetical protein
MESQTLPTKAARDAAVKLIRRDAPTKDQPDSSSDREQRTHLPSKVPVEKTRYGAKARGESEGHPATHGPVDQQPPQRASSGGEQYVRFTVRVDNGKFSVVDSQIVDGPLAQTAALLGRFAYEVSDGKRMLHAGSIPDLGMVRAFADMQGTLEQHRHHTYQLSTYEFDVRVPAEALRRVALSNVAITLFRVKTPDLVGTKARPLSDALLIHQRGEQLGEVGRVVGIPADVLEPSFKPESAAPERTRGVKSREPNPEGYRDEEKDKTSD